MSKFPFTAGEELLEHFDLDDSDYFQPTVLSDVKAGFSVQREYPHSLPYKPPRYRDGSPDVVAIIHVVYEDPDDPDITSTREAAPVRVRIGTFCYSWVRSPFYDPTSDEFPTLESVENSRKTPEPVPLQRTDDLAFNHDVDLFFDKKNRSLAGRQVLDELFDLHCRTSVGLRKASIRSRLRAKSIALRVLSSLLDSGHWALRVFFGRKLRDSNEFIASLGGYSEKTPRLVVEERINFLGYHAPMNTDVTFAGALLLLLGISYAIAPDGHVGSWVLQNEVTSVALAIFGLWLLDYLGPRLIFGLMKLVGRLRAAVLFRQFEVN